MGDASENVIWVVLGRTDNNLFCYSGAVYAGLVAYKHLISPKVSQLVPKTILKIKAKC